MPSPQTLLRYVLLRHECPADYRDGPHWDLMLEDGDALRTWSLLELPAAWGGSCNQGIAATRLPDHRLAYLEREGEISGGRGSVTRVARGDYKWLMRTEGELRVAAPTGKLAGEWRLRRLEGNRWQLEVER